MEALRESPAPDAAGKAPSTQPLAGTSPRDLRGAIALASLVGLTGSGAAVAVGAAAGTAFLAPVRGGEIPRWVSGPLAELGSPLGAAGYAALLVAMFACYGVVLALSGAIRPAVALAGVAVLHAVFALAPPVVTPDVFSYVAYARLGATHGLNPYTAAPAAAPFDPVLAFVAFRDLPSPYGPLWTLASYPLAWLSLPAAVWTVKGLSAAASLGCVALVWSTARRLGRKPLLPALIVGLNPILLVNGVGGAHNDFLMMLAVLGGVRLAVGGREGLGAGAIAAGVAVKATAGLVLPFLVLGARRRVRTAAAAAGALALVLLAWLLAFGPSGLTGFAHALSTQNAMVSEVSVPWLLGALAGEEGLSSPVRAASIAAFVLAVGALALAVIRRRLSWIDASGWAVLALLATTSWLMPYYVAWLLPLGALGSPRVRGAALAASALVGLSRIALLFV